jgi:hypothetical protein
MGKEKPIEKIEGRFGYILIDGQYYKGATKDGKPIFKKISNETVNRRIKMAREVAQEIKGSLDPEAVLVESIMKFEDHKDIEKLHNIVFNSKRQHQAKTRAHHCVDMKVGNFIIPIVE